ncbi:MAG: ATP-binding cassette domain-containing protein [Fibrobacterota bacterium]
MFSIKTRGLAMYSHVGRYPSIDLTIDEGSTSIFTGPCGSGKSFLLELAAGIKSPPTGRVLWNDEDISRLPEAPLQQYRLQSGVSFQQPTLINFLPVFDNLALPLRYHRHYPADVIDQKANALIRQFELDKQKYNLPERLSSGQKKLVSIARALITSPSVLLLDEPTESLDPLQVKKIVETLTIIKQVPEKSIIIATGDDSLIEQINSHIYYLDGHRVHFFHNYNVYRSFKSRETHEQNH